MTENLFQYSPTPIKLSSGVLSDFKIDCDALSEADIGCIAYLLAPRVQPFSTVESVPSGGDRLAKAMEEYKNDKIEGPLLIVDDVLTTGASMARQRAGRWAVGAVIFARIEPPLWIAPLFQMRVI